MFRNFAIAAVIALGIVGLRASKAPSYSAGSWQVDTRHSDVQLITDATTDYGKNKINITLGFGRINGTMQLNDADPSKSNVELHIYRLMLSGQKC